MFPKGKREPLQMVIQRRRREFHQPFRLADKDAHELWNSSQMECRCEEDEVGAAEFNIMTMRHEGEGTLGGKRALSLGW